MLREQMTYGDVGVYYGGFLAVSADEATCELVQWRGNNLEDAMFLRKQRLEKASVFFEPSETGHHSSTSSSSQFVRCQLREETLSTDVKMLYAQCHVKNLH